MNVYSQFFNSFKVNRVIRPNNFQFVAWKEHEVVQEFDLAVARLAERNTIYGDDEIAADVKAAISEVRDASTRP